ncbi:HPP family protein [Ammoniphilus sp. CFH 90114]|uniref:HPP family protein n=1 Tax=Ammoniphilus sp. CFH 90114 TaxID=2493665 RepID=UPI00100DFB17|nr:HPP family protein [Ammoniphilus sp. CFH 90114]RXT03638.1 HPP family protein [Ammoniphilus sp. CFH 90114]
MIMGQLKPYIAKMRGTGKSPLKVIPKTLLISSVGGFLTIALLVYMTNVTSSILLMAPFGASCVLAFAVWESPLSQPRNIIGGHLVSTAVGLGLYHLWGNQPWVLALGVGLAIGAMIVTRTTHPPAGADPIVVILAGSSWGFLFTPVLLGSIIIVVAALLFNNLDENRRYPTFWV